MANATPQNIFNVQVTRPQLKLLNKMLNQEILTPDSSILTILKQTLAALIRPLLQTVSIQYKTLLKIETFIKYKKEQIFLILLLLIL